MNQITFLATTMTLVILALPASGLAQSTRPSRQHVFPPLNPNLPTLWLIGDSTVRNGHDLGENGQWGWGNPIAYYFDQSRINVQNRALGGTSSRTYRTISDFWPAILPMIKSGDFLIIQFGHNDGGPLNDNTRARGTIKGNGDETEEIDNQLTGQHEVVHTYGWYIRQCIREAREKGATVIVCSPIPRNRWPNGKIGRDKYSDWAQEAAEQGGAAFIDLNQRVIEKYTALGEAKVTAELFPENETTHTDWAGAVLNAECVVEGIKSLDHHPLAGFLLKDPPRDLKNPTGKPR